MKNIITITIVFLSLLSFGQQYSERWTDVDYVGTSQVYHRLDIYLPSEIKESYPVVIMIYGSAWQSNSSKGADMTTLGSALLDAGYAVVTPNHRSSSDAIFPAQIHDIKAVIRFVRGNADEYKFNPCFVGITGSSSGGHLAALAGTTNGVDNFTVNSESANIEGSLGSFTQHSSIVHAVCDWFGPTDLTIISSCENGNFFDHDGPSSPGSALIGAHITQNLDKAALINPITYVDPTDPPFLIIHGNSDQVVPHCQSEVLYAALQAGNVESEYIMVPGGGHGPNVHVATYINRMVDFFDDIKNTTCSDRPNLPVVTSPVSYCENEDAAPLSASGTSLKWYNTAEDGTASTTAPTPSTNTVGATIYYVSQTVNNVESERASITVNIVEKPQQPTVNSPINYTQNQLATPLTAVGTSLKWYLTINGNSISQAPTPSTESNGNTYYYVSQTVNGCESELATISVVVSNNETDIMNLRAGWNIIGYPFDESILVEEAFSSIWQYVVAVKNLEAYYEVEGPQILNSLTELHWGEGCFIKVSEDCEFSW